MDIELEQFDYLMEVPYRHMGRDAKTGLDCYGLLMHVYGALGHPVPDYAYVNDPGRIGALIAEKIHEIWEKIPPIPPLTKGGEGGFLPGDAVLMWYEHALPNHVGVYLGGENGLVLHMTRKGAVKAPLKRLREIGRAHV